MKKMSATNGFSLNILVFITRDGSRWLLGGGGRCKTVNGVEYHALQTFG